MWIPRCLCLLSEKKMLLAAQFIVPAPDNAGAQQKGALGHSCWRYWCRSSLAMNRLKTDLPLWQSKFQGWGTLGRITLKLWLLLPVVQYLEKVGLNLNLEVVQAHELGKVGEVIVTKYDALFWKEKVKSLKLRKVLKKSHISTNVNEEENWGKSD